MAHSTLVIQSHRTPLPYRWLESSIDSVLQWAKQNSFDYEFVGDDKLFSEIAPDLLQKTAGQKVIATDLGRLKLLQEGLRYGYQTVVWCDADFLIFDPRQFKLPPANYALGHEVWIQFEGSGKLKAYKKVHNAFLMFRQGNYFLDFYTDTAERLLRMNQGSMPPQFIGPKLLTALHNIVQCPVLETAGMLSPLVINDLLQGGGKALDLFLGKSPVEIYGANLSASLVNNQRFSEGDMDRVIESLIRSGCQT